MLPLTGYKYMPFNPHCFTLHSCSCSSSRSLFPLSSSSITLPSTSYSVPFFGLAVSLLPSITSFASSRPFSLSLSFWLFPLAPLIIVLSHVYGTNSGNNRQYSNCFIRARCAAQQRDAIYSRGLDVRRETLWTMEGFSTTCRPLSDGEN